MNLSVIIAHYNEPEHLVATIRSIRQTAPIENVEIIVVDDGGLYPEDSGSEPVADFSSKENIKFIANRERRGNAFCRTLGASHASGDWLMFTDAHMEFEPRWFENFTGHAESLDGPTLFCGPYISSREEYEREGREPDIFYGARFYYWEKGNRETDVIGIKPLGDPGHPIGLTSWPVPSVIGANYFVKKDWFHRIGALHCQCGWSIDEWPLSVKTWLSGGQVRLMPNVRVKHILYRTGVGRDGYGRQMNQGQLLFNKLSVAFQTMPETLYEHFERSLPLSPRAPALVEARRMIQDRIEELHYWRNRLAGIFKFDVDWLVAKFDLDHPADLAAET